ncbi:type II secretion system F family protein, partial [Lactobacillus nasalidis]
DQQMRQGEHLSSLLAGLGFGKTTVTQLNMAMSQGRLTESLTQLTVLGRMKNEQIKKLQAELAYPAVLGGMMVLVLVFMQKFLSVEFADSNSRQGDLLLTLLVILMLAAGLLLVLAAACLKKQDYRSFKQLLAWPILGPVVGLYGQYLVCYDLGMLLASGFSLQQMCAFASQQTPGSLQEQVGRRAREQLLQGKKIEEIIQEEPFLHQDLLMLLQAGCERGELSRQCLLLSRLLFNRLRQKLAKLIVNVQPICFILIGLCIIGMYLKLLLPIYDSMQQL